MHLTVTKVHGMLPIKHLEEWLAYGKCSVNISFLHLNYNRTPIYHPHRTHFSHTAWPWFYNVFISSLPVWSPFPPHAVWDPYNYCICYPLWSFLLWSSHFTSLLFFFYNILKPRSLQWPQLQVFSTLTHPTYEILSMTLLCPKFSKLQHCLLSSLLTIAFKTSHFWLQSTFPGISPT